MAMMVRVKTGMVAAVAILVIMAAQTELQAAVEVWVGDLIADAAAGPTAPAGGSMLIAAARNGVFSARAIVESAAAIKGLSASMGELAMGATKIAAKDVQVRYAVSWKETWRRYRPRGLDILLESPPASIAVYRRSKRATVA